MALSFGHSLLTEALIVFLVCELNLWKRPQLMGAADALTANIDDRIRRRWLVLAISPWPRRRARP